MSRIMILGGNGTAAALMALIATQALTLGVKPWEVVLVDDSLPPSEGDDNTISVISTREAEKRCLILGAGNYASRFPVEHFTLNCVEPYLPESVPSFQDIRQSRPQGRHPFDRKQQSMQAKARRR